MCIATAIHTSGSSRALRRRAVVRPRRHNTIGRIATRPGSEQMLLHSSRRTRLAHSDGSPRGARESRNSPAIAFISGAAPEPASASATFRIRGFGGLGATAGMEEQPRRGQAIARLELSDSGSLGAWDPVR